MKVNPASFAVSAAVAAILALSASTTMASSHGEAPYVKTRPKLDATDFYLFNSYEPGRDDYVTLIANYVPLQDVYGGPNYFSMNDNAIYEIHIDNDGDAIEDLTFVFDFDNSLANGETGLAVPVGDQMVPVPLKNIGILGTPNNNAILNVNETYFVGTVQGDRRSQSPVWAVRPDSGLRLFTKPYDYVGEKSFPRGYDNYLKRLSNTDEIYYNVNFDQCPEGAQSGRVFAGQRKDSFSVALGEIFDLVNFVPLVDALPDDPARNDLADKNITTLALEVHKDCLTGSGNGVIGAWTSSSVRATETISETPSFRQPSEYSGEFRQVSRLSNPLVNEVVIGMPDKNNFNSSEPKDDGQFAVYVTNPTLPAIIDILFREPLGAADNIAPAFFPRTDLVAAFLTGFEGVNQLASVTPSEMLRLNTGIPATARDSQSNLGVAAGDLGGFPNGRRPGDDVVDLALRVVMGALCHPIAVDLDGSGTAGDEGDNLGLCAPGDAPVGTAALTDGAPQNAMQFSNTFPYLTTPITGSFLAPAASDAPMNDGSAMMDGGEMMNGGNMMSDNTGMNPLCPVDPGALNGNALSSTELEILWDAAFADAGIAGYEVYLDGNFLEMTGDLSYQMDGLDPDSNYLFEVIPVTNDGARLECNYQIMLSTNS